MDIALTQLINDLAGHVPAIDQTMIFITTYGIFALVIATILLWWRPQDRQSTRNACFVVGLSFLVSLAFNQFLLLFIHRIRPYEVGVTHLLIAPNPDWSFPSDHATAASAVIAGLWFKGQFRFAIILGLLATLICLSRIYVGVHYASDVVGGAFIGTLVAFAVSYFYRDDSWYAKRIIRIL